MVLVGVVGEVPRLLLAFLVQTIERNLHDPQKRKYIGTCCMTKDGTIRGLRTYGDATCKPSAAVKTQPWYKGPPIYECMGCREPLEHKTEEEMEDDRMWAGAEEIAAKQMKKQRSE